MIVDFLEGDPDQPIIIGSVFNADTMPLYELTANETRSGVKSHSSIGGGGYNEIRFEDKKGSDEIWVHGEKDLNTVIVNNETREVGVDRTTTIKTGNESLTVRRGIARRKSPRATMS